VSRGGGTLEKYYELSIQQGVCSGGWPSQEREKPAWLGTVFWLATWYKPPGDRAEEYQ